MSFACFRREVDENCSLLDCYAASSGNSLPTFRGNLSVPSSRWDRQVVPKRQLEITTTSCAIVRVSSSPRNRIIINRWHREVGLHLSSNLAILHVCELMICLGTRVIR
jgi:hypothetical protein